jgi:ABC-2 type transport system ATP-binding protein
MLIDLIIGETVPTSGRVRTCGLQPDVDHERLAQRVGVVSGARPQLWQDLPLEESLRILAEAHHLSEDRRLARRAELVERLNLAAFITMPAGRLSPGRRIRGEVAAALMHEPELLILDRPMVGLDVVSKERLRSFLREENRVHGRTVLITAEELGDVEEVCDRLLVVDQGRVMHDGDLPELISRAGLQRTLVVELTDADRILDDVPGTTLIGVEAGGGGSD